MLNEQSLGISRAGLTLLVCALGLIACDGASETNDAQTIPSEEISLTTKDQSEDLLSQDEIIGSDQEEKRAEQVCAPPMEDSPTWYSDVERIFFENCVICHAEQPVYGAPNSLVSYSDSKGQSFSNSDISMLDMIGARIADGSMPPSSQPGLSVSDREVLDRWIAECAPEGDVADRDETVPVKAQVPPPPVDAKVMEFSASGFEVPTKNDHYMCFPFEISLDKPRDIIRFDYFLDKAEVIHHIVLYGDPDNEGGSEPFECGGTAVDHSEFMYAWAPGGQPLQFPDGYGFPVTDGDRVILQVHYNNVKKIEDLKDSTGVRFYMKDPQDEEVGMTAIGPLKIQVPPFSEASSESACYIDKETTILTSAPHMHEIGKSFRQVVIREDGTEELIVALDNWDFNEQYGFHTPFTLYPGDRLVTRCDFENPHAYPVVQGDDTNNEMCFNFAYLYPPMESSFCDDPLNLEELVVVDDVPGVCATDVAMGPPVEGGILIGDVESNPDYLTSMPEGEWVMTEFSAVLPASLLDDYQLNLEDSTSVAQASMRFGKAEEGTQSAILDLDLSLTLSVGNGGTFPIQNAYSFGGTLVPGTVETGEGMTRDSSDCEKGQISLSQIRMTQSGEKLVGYLTFTLEFGSLGYVDYYGEFERAESP